MKNKILDGVIGLCVADAVGVPVEFFHRETLTKDPVIEMRSYGTYHQPAGTWSDDTSMTLCLVDSLTNGLEYEDIMKKFLRWFKEGAYTPYEEVFDIGIATREALLRYLDGTPPLQCGGTSEYDNGNGSLMRILPILFYLQSNYGADFMEKDEALTIIHNVSALTHAHKRSQLACGIYISIAARVNGKNDLKMAVKQGIYEAMEYYRNHADFNSELQYFARLESKTFANLPIAQIKSSGYVVDTLEAAIWCLLNTSSYQECVLKAVNLGEDTDSVAAVAGGLAGLHYGYEAIPKKWLITIAKRDYIENLCNKLRDSLQYAAVEKLVCYVPYFESATKESVSQWSGNKKLAESHFTMSYPEYEQRFDKFIKAVYKSNLMCHNYLAKIEKLDIEMSSAIDTADIDLLRAILTYHVRAERFCEGAWAAAVDDGVFLKILKRFCDLKAQLEDV